jgi:predicted MFS family arabinose efflux permease
LIKLGFFLNFIGNILIGPSTYFGIFPEEIWVMCIGLAFLGIASPFLCIPVVPSIIRIAEERNKNILRDHGSNKLMDLSAGIYTTSINLGFWITPLISSALCENYGYHITTDFMAILCLISGISFYMMTVYKDKYEKRRNDT